MGSSGWLGAGRLCLDSSSGLGRVGRVPPEANGFILDAGTSSIFNSIFSNLFEWKIGLLEQRETFWPMGSQGPENPRCLAPIPSGAEGIRSWKQMDSMAVRAELAENVMQIWQSANHVHPINVHLNRFFRSIPDHSSSNYATETLIIVINTLESTTVVNLWSIITLCWMNFIFFKFSGFFDPSVFTF